MSYLSSHPCNVKCEVADTQREKRGKGGLQFDDDGFPSLAEAGREITNMYTMLERVYDEIGIKEYTKVS